MGVAGGAAGEKILMVMKKIVIELYGRITLKAGFFYFFEKYIHIQKLTAISSVYHKNYLICLSRDATSPKRWQRGWVKQTFLYFNYRSQ